MLNRRTIGGGSCWRVSTASGNPALDQQVFHDCSCRRALGDSSGRVANPSVSTSTGYDQHSMVHAAARLCRIARSVLHLHGVQRFRPRFYNEGVSMAGWHKNAASGLSSLLDAVLRGGLPHPGEWRFRRARTCVSSLDRA